MGFANGRAGSAGVQLANFTCLVTTPRVPTSTYRLQFNSRVHVRTRSRDRRLPPRARRQRLLRFVVSEGRDRQSARLRRGRPDLPEPRHRHRGRVLGVDRGACAAAAWATCSTSCRITWASRSRRIDGGSTSWKTGPARDSPGSSTSNGVPVKDELADKVLIPILGDQYGAVLERQELTLAFQDGAFVDPVLRRPPADRAGHVRPDSRMRAGRTRATGSAITRARRPTNCRSFSRPPATCRRAARATRS